MKIIQLIFELERGRNLVVNHEDNKVFRSRNCTIGLIVTPWKFDFLKTSFKNIIFFAEQLSADSSLTETLCCLNRNLELII